VTVLNLAAALVATVAVVTAVLARRRDPSGRWRVLTLGAVLVMAVGVTFLLVVSSALSRP
jgi:multisubunit Na+/H+ antiporter MnhB subunit